MQKCQYCGNEMSDTASFCSSCGQPSTQSDVICRYCGSTVQKGAASCNRCGRQVVQQNVDFVGNVSNVNNSQPKTTTFDQYQGEGYKLADLISPIISLICSILYLIYALV